MDVQFVGETSYGKPVGFFDIDINKYKMYIPEFSTMNSANQGGYYDGFTPGSATYPGVSADDDASKDFGDPTEGLLARILNYVKKGTYTVNSLSTQSITKVGALSASDRRSMAVKINPHKFTGMIFNKELKLKKK
jgi:hypothetical protein